MPAFLERGSLVNGAPDTGVRFGLDALHGFLTVYSGYVSGTALSGTTTFANQTFASLGLTAGTYTYGIPNDTLTVEIPTVPEPAAWALMLVGVGLIGAGMREAREDGVAPIAA